MKFPEKLAQHPLLRPWLTHDAHPFIQFIKYGLSGGCATVTNIVVLYIFSIWVWPCLTQDDPVRSLLNLPAADGISQSVRALRSVLCNVPAFLISNAVAYLLNILFVFKAGRHHWAVEIALFYAVSGIAFALGTALQWLLIHFFGLTTSAAIGANILTAVMINYAVRKYIIFKG